MNKFLLPAFLLCSGIALAQTGKTIFPGYTPPVKTQFEFSEKQALEEAKARGLQPADYEGYIRYKKRQLRMHNDALPVSGDLQSTKKTTHPNQVSNASNIDFETGDYTGWSAYAGENTVNSFGPLQGIHPVTPGQTDTLYMNYVYNNCNLYDTTGRHGLMTAALGNDPICGMPLVSPLGGNYAARLNRFCANFEAAILEQTFTVTASQTWLNYAYAVVLEDGGHAPGEQAYFSSYLLDAMGDTIPLSYAYMQAANGTTPGFYPALNPNTTYTYYKPWTPVSVDLSAYVGQTVTLHFTASDCIYGGHSGYAYIDALMDSVSNVPNVWPGDANYDLVADINDLFYIGWAYGATGTARAGATNTWQAEPSADWGMITAYGTEFKHADCNGDGVVDLNDTLALVNNYGMNHPYKLMNPAAVDNISSYRNVTISSPAPFVNPNQTFAVNFNIPASGVTVDQIYGISFRLHVPTQYIAAMTSNDYLSSFLGTNGTDMITMARPDIANGYIDYALVRRDHQDSYGAGYLFAVNLTATNFSGSGSGDFTISNIKAATYGGQYLPIGSTTLSMSFTSPTGIETHTNAGLVLRPNPASDKLFVDGIKGNAKFEIVSIIGQIVLQSQLIKNTAVDVSSLEKGAYFIKIYSPEGTQIKKFIKE